MDGFVTAIAAVIYALTQWRVLLCVGVSIALAVALAHAFDWFGGAHGLALVLVGLGCGVMCQARAEGGLMFAKTPSPPISKPVQLLAFAFSGSVFGAWLTYWLGSPLAAVLVMVAAPFIVGGLRTLLLKRALPFRDLVFVSASMLAGFAVLAGLGIFVRHA